MARILIVDDSRLARRMLRTILEQAGYDVREAENGLSALELYALERPDLVLLDMLMADMNGIEVLARLLEVDPQARVIVATADVQDSTREMTEAAGSCGFVQKPFVPDEVLSTVKESLEGGCNGPVA